MHPPNSKQKECHSCIDVFAKEWQVKQAPMVPVVFCDHHFFLDCYLLHLIISIGVIKT